MSAALLVAAAAACGGSSSGSDAAACAQAVPSATAGQVLDGPPPVPTTGAYLGAAAFTGTLYTEERRIASVNALQTAICRPLDIVHSYVPWQTTFPTDSELTASRSGQLLLMSWTGTDMREMAAGTDDAEIRRVATEVAALHSPVFVEFRWEMERPNLASVVHSPADFIAAWDHTRAIFDQVGVHNASWVWCPTATGFDNHTAEAYYPGASQVDWICTDAYPQPVGSLESLQSELTAFMAWAVPQGKPLMIGEVGVPLSYTAGQRDAWIDNALLYLRSTPAIKAFVYFDLNPIGHDTDRDWLLPAGSSALEHFKQLGSDPWFAPKVVPTRAPTVASTAQPTSG